MTTRTAKKNNGWNALELPKKEAPGQIRALIEGVSPLLMHNPAGSMTVADSDRAKVKATPSPKEEAEGGLYRWPDGQLFIPAIAVYNALIEVGSSLKYKNLKETKYGSRKIIAAGIQPMREGFGLIDKKDKPIKEHRVDTRRVVLKNGAKSVGILRSRGYIQDWRVLVELEWDRGVVGDGLMQIVADALVDAGKIAGLLDYRPGKSYGPYGRFQVVSFEYR